MLPALHEIDRLAIKPGRETFAARLHHQMMKYAGVERLVRTRIRHHGLWIETPYPQQSRGFQCHPVPGRSAANHSISPSGCAATEVRTRVNARSRPVVWNQEL